MLRERAGALPVPVSRVPVVLEAPGRAGGVGQDVVLDEARVRSEAPGVHVPATPAAAVVPVAAHELLLRQGGPHGPARRDAVSVLEGRGGGEGPTRAAGALVFNPVARVAQPPVSHERVEGIRVIHGRGARRRGGGEGVAARYGIARVAPHRPLRVAIQLLARDIAIRIPCAAAAIAAVGGGEPRRMAGPRGGNPRLGRRRRTRRRRRWARRRRRGHDLNIGLEDAGVGRAALVRPVDLAPAQVVAVEDGLRTVAVWVVAAASAVTAVPGVAPVLGAGPLGYARVVDARLARAPSRDPILVIAVEACLLVLAVRVGRATAAITTVAGGVPSPVAPPGGWRRALLQPPPGPCARGTKLFLRYDQAQVPLRNLGVSEA
mmetsp:Transcript_17168/g.49808  ORF Transcript_17168/g.49808 Transcript_17168/m.49808 type:complete len:376 (+) Transcript_17168:1011-2138(+)